MVLIITRGKHQIRVYNYGFPLGSYTSLFVTFCYFSQAILADKTLYVSGVLGLDAEAQLVCGGAEAQTKQALVNLRHVLEAGGASMESVVKTTILLGDMNDFQVVNQVYAEFFRKDYPARATYQVAKLPMGAAVEIEAIALSGDLVVAEAGPKCT
ncbi:Ubiquitin fusion degradation protein 1-like protein [Operophtera brumata]|uniref:Ubiquitin fusion degradation protein 1-like protein n=1 Tax=Operophtera brumata TaxID=104452 RepID=A0A0L7KL57_OPEBR|nr:Ubiquitin fusion degradation protein 1-like protein [Operophtera brumata]